MQKNIIEALTLFGPLNAKQIKEKLALRELYYPLDWIMLELDCMVAMGQIRLAKGFETKTYKL